MNEDKIKSKQQKLIYQVVGATAFPSTGKIEIKDIWTAIRQGDAEATARIFQENPVDHKLSASLYVSVAASLGHLKTTKFLVENGANPDHGLSAAAEENHPILVDYLLEKGAKGIQHAMTKAVEDDNVGMLNHLISRGGSLDHNESEPLRWAAMQGSREVIHSILLDHKADPTIIAKQWLKDNGHTYPLELITKRDLKNKLEDGMPKKLKGPMMKI